MSDRGEWHPANAMLRNVKPEVVFVAREPKPKPKPGPVTVSVTLPADAAWDDWKRAFNAAHAKALRDHG